MTIEGGSGDAMPLCVNRVADVMTGIWWTEVMNTSHETDGESVQDTSVLLAPHSLGVCDD